MIEMGVSQQYRINPFRRYRKRRAIAIAKLLVALKETAVDEDAVPVRFEQVARSGDRAGGAEKLKRR